MENLNSNYWKDSSVNFAKLCKEVVYSIYFCKNDNVDISMEERMKLLIDEIGKKELRIFFFALSLIAFFLFHACKKAKKDSIDKNISMVGFFLDLLKFILVILLICKIHIIIIDIYIMKFSIFQDLFFMLILLFCFFDYKFLKFINPLSDIFIEKVVFSIIIILPIIFYFNQIKEFLITNICQTLFK